MEIGSGGTGEAIPAAPVPYESTETLKNRIRAVLSPDKLEMVCHTLLIPSNMKQFGFILAIAWCDKAGANETKIWRCRKSILQIFE